MNHQLIKPRTLGSVYKRKEGLALNGLLSIANLHANTYNSRYREYQEGNYSSQSVY